MAIEKDLGRIASALEGILAHLSAQVIDRGTPSDSHVTLEAPEAPAAPAPAPSVPAPAPSAPAPAPAAPAPSPAPAAPAAPSAAPAGDFLTAEQLNAALVIEFNRLGGRDKIMEVLKKYGNGTASVNAVDVSNYGNVIAEVRAA